MNAYAFIASPQQYHSNMRTQITENDDILVLEDAGSHRGFRKAYSLDGIYSNCDELFASIPVEGSHRMFMLFSNYSFPKFTDFKNMIISFFCNFYQFFIPPVSIGLASIFDKHTHDYLNTKTGKQYDLFSTENLDEALDLIDVSFTSLKGIDKSIFVARLGGKNFIELVVVSNADTLIKEYDIASFGANLKMLYFLAKSPKMSQSTLETALKVSPYIGLMADSLVNTPTSWICTVIESSPLIANTELFKYFQIANTDVFSKLKLNSSLLELPNCKNNQNFNPELIQSKLRNEKYRGDIFSLDQPTRKKLFPGLKLSPFKIIEPEKRPSTPKLISKTSPAVKERDIPIPVDVSENIEIIETKAPLSPGRSSLKSGISGLDYEESNLSFDLVLNSINKEQSQISDFKDEIDMNSAIGRKKKKITPELLWPEEYFDKDAPINVETVENVIKEMKCLLPDVNQTSEYEYEEEESENNPKIEQLSDEDYKELNITLNLDDSDDDFDEKPKSVKSRSIRSDNSQNSLLIPSETKESNPNSPKPIQIVFPDLETIKSQAQSRIEADKASIDHITVKFPNGPIEMAESARNIANDPRSNIATLTLESLDVQNEIHKINTSLNDIRTEISNLQQKSRRLNCESQMTSSEIENLIDTFIPLRQSLIHKRLQNANFDFKQSPKIVEMLDCINRLQMQIEKLQNSNI